MTARARLRALLAPIPLASIPLAAICVAGAVLLALCALATARIPLPRYFPSAGISLDFVKMLGPGWERTTVEYVAVLLSAFVCYAVALVATLRGGRSLPLWLLLGFPALFAAALLWMYPPTAVDLFHYHADARTFWVFGDNPLTVPPLAHGYPIGISWEDQPSPYGPGWSLATVVIAPLLWWSGSDLAALIGLKALAAASLLASAWLVRTLAERMRPGSGAIALVLFAWNPYVLLRVVGNGHNDIVMMLFALLALERAQRGHWTLALPCLALSVLVKYATALLVPALLLYAWHHAGGTPRQRARALVPGAALAALATLAAFAPFWAGAATFDTVRGEAAKSITSVPDVLFHLLQRSLDPDRARTVAQTITRLLFAVIAIPLIWRARRSFDDLLTSAFHLLFLALVIAIAWFRPPYMLWPLTLLALRPGGWTIALFLAISVGNSFPDLIEQFRWYWGISDNFAQRAAPVLAQFPLPVLIWLAAAVATRSLRLERPARAAPLPAPARAAAGG